MKQNSDFKTLRAGRGLSLEELSKISGYSVAAINGLEVHGRGSKRLKAKLLEILDPASLELKTRDEANKENSEFLRAIAKVEKCVQELQDYVSNMRAAVKSRIPLHQEPFEERIKFAKNNSQPRLLKSLEKICSAPGGKIGRKKLVFEDLAQLDKASIQKIVREVDMHDLAISVVAAGPERAAAFLQPLSEEADDKFIKECASVRPLTGKDIMDANLRIIDVVRQLASQKEIDLSNTNFSTPRRVKHKSKSAS